MENKKMKKVFIEYGITIAIAIIIAICITQFVRPTKVVGQSMEQTLSNKDLLLLNKMAYKNDKPKYKDIVVIDAGSNFNEKFIIKRVIGVPGDKVQVKGNQVFINGNLLDEPYINDDEEVMGNYNIDITLNENEIFVMGDNRNHSADSRNPRVGAINYKQKVLGKIFLRIYPFNKIPVY